jgi:membrane-associated phospholipid phosphatase
MLQERSYPRAVLGAEGMHHSPEPEAAPGHSRRPEIHRRFALLRALIYDRRLRHRLVFAGALLALLAVAGLTVLASLYAVFPLDVEFTQELQEDQWALVSQLMYLVSLPGYAPWSWLLVCAVTLLLGLLLGWRDGLYLLLLTVAQGLVNGLIKRAIGRPRPIDSLVEVFVPNHGFSFPSGHVMFYTVFFGFLLFLVLTRMPASGWRWAAGLPLAALVLLIGPSRIILGAHWLSDVLAAYLLSLVILVLGIEGYIHFLAPSRPEAQRGLVGRLDERREGPTAPTTGP